MATSSQGLRSIIIALAVVFLLGSTSSEKPKTGSVCVAPVPADASPFSGQLLTPCPGKDMSLRIDHNKPRPWPLENHGSVEIDGFDLAAAHTVVILCGGKPQQGFRFRFSEFKGTHLCLFINDLYRTAQLWDPKESPAPWCKCKNSSK